MPVRRHRPISLACLTGLHSYERRCGAVPTVAASSTMTDASPHDDKPRRLLQAARNMALIWDDALAERLVAADDGLALPDEPEVVLEYLGPLEPLDLAEHWREHTRRGVEESIERHGARWVWESRVRLRVELVWVIYNW